MSKTSSRISSQLSKLERYIHQVPQKMKGLSIADLQHPLEDGKWSRKEILGHLIDSSAYNWQRFLNIQFSEQPFQLHSYAQKELVETNDYQHKPLSDLLDLWAQINQQILFTARSLDEEKLQLKVIAPWGSYAEGDSDLAWLINDYVAHMEHHLRQIFGSLDAIQADENGQISMQQAQQGLDSQSAQRFVTLFQRGSLSVEWYQPKDVDLQSPHEQDELYVVASGSGIFYNNGQRQAFGSGDLLFVPAGVEHRFENFTDDFKTWVIFYGPQGGEAYHAPLETHLQSEGSTYTISTAPERLDAIAIHAFLTHSYWAKGRTLEAVHQTLNQSFSFGLYHQDQQIGLARVVTDFAGFAYLCDVYVLEVYRGKELGKWLIKTVIECERLASIKNWLLFTDDAHTLYEPFGFKAVSADEILMRWERKNT